MISKELFVEVIENIRKQEEKNDRFSKALNEMCDGWPLWDVNNLYLRSLLKVLEEIFHDNYGTVSWFLWENVEKTIWLADGTPIDVSTPEKLYDYLVDCMIADGFKVDLEVEKKPVNNTEASNNFEPAEVIVFPSYDGDPDDNPEEILDILM